MIEVINSVDNSGNSVLIVAFKHDHELAFRRFSVNLGTVKLRNLLLNMIQLIG